MFKLLSLFLLLAILYDVCGHNFGGKNPVRLQEKTFVNGTPVPSRIFYEGSDLDKLQSIYIANLPFKNKILSDADLQSALMPQELNPAIVFDKDAPWRAVFPPLRQRRDIEVVAEASLPSPVTAVPQTLKLYSRVATCVALAVGAIVEIILYIIECYTVV